jgi:hypothetical protein
MTDALFSQPAYVAANIALDVRLRRRGIQDRAAALPYQDGEEFCPAPNGIKSFGIIPLTNIPMTFRPSLFF